jgi:hypothetical protein
VKQKRIISASDFQKRPAWFNALNAVWKRAYKRGSSPFLNKDELLLTARRTTGLNDLGKDFWDEPLERLILSLNHEAMLHPIGAFISRKRIINLLSVRLRAEYWFRNHPEILDQELYPPLIIVGLQRTGTTKLHRLLSADPDNRVLKSWEAINPAPMHRNVNRKERRIRAAKASENALRKMAPGFFAIHPVEYSAPEEDILLLDVTFLSTTPEAITHVPSYAEWLEKTDQSYAYEYGSRLMRFLQWQQPGKRWILKSPHHLEFLPLIDKYYGEPSFLWTHRELSECIPSFLSMVCHSRAIFSDEVRVEDVAGHWVRKTSYMLEKGMSYRSRGNNHLKFTDILYENLVSDSMGELEKIYNGNSGLPDCLAERFRMAEIENPKGKYGVHEYGLEEFGLTREGLISRNRQYFDLYSGLVRKDQVP